ncbi:MAG: ABC transporter ATP-binding protein [Nitrospiraceae bacterium]|nr:MAG: ABC transporter ATP-binding protein [Nitrospiraceae bacterium]UCH44014.1 MAG: ABC transporter ATP-binding protein [Nitrospiraceae bacterium]
MNKDTAAIKPLLDIKDLKVYFDTDEGLVKSVDGVNLQIMKGTTLGLVGESGCGKSVTCLSIPRLIECPPGMMAGGEIIYKGRNLLALPEKDMETIRGNDISMIFQEPMTSLNPVFTIGDQIKETIMLHQEKNDADARELTIQILRKVGIPSPDIRIDEYPHQMSGGMKQRVMIAMALSCNPELLIADEPSTALDVTIQAQILDLMQSLQDELGMSILMVTHDLGVVASIASHVAIMYASKIVEYGPADAIFGNPRHPYTLGLFTSIPVIGRKKEHLYVIPGNVPNPLAFPEGCKFWPRCLFAEDRCRAEEPKLTDIMEGHTSACHFSKDIDKYLWKEKTRTASFLI